MCCEFCTSPNLVYIGMLGSMEYFRCRDCGMNTAEETESDDD